MIGIYKIENLINHKVYIGQSVSIKDRLKHHKQMLIKNKHFCSHLQKSWNKYGESNFIFEVIEECAKEDLDDREIYWIDYYGGYESNQNYNQRMGGQETHKISERTKEKIRQANLGKKQSEEVVRKRAEAIKGHPFWGRKRTEEEKRKQSERQKGKINTKILNFDRTNSIYRQHLSESLKGKKKTKEHALHISQGRKGMVFTEEHKKNISLNRKGIPSIPKGSKKMEKGGIVKWAKPEEIETFKQEGWQEYHRFDCGNYVRVSSWNKGISCTEEQKINLRNKNLGKKLSKETKMKMSKARKGCVWINNGLKNKIIKKELMKKYFIEGWKKGRYKK